MEKFDDKTENRFFHMKQYKEAEVITFNYDALEEITTSSFIASLKNSISWYNIEKFVIDEQKDGSKLFYIYATDYSFSSDKMKSLVVHAYLKNDYSHFSRIQNYVFEALDLTVSTM